MPCRGRPPGEVRARRGAAPAHAQSFAVRSRGVNATEDPCGLVYGASDDSIRTMLWIICSRSRLSSSSPAVVLWRFSDTLV